MNVDSEGHKFSWIYIVVSIPICGWLIMLAYNFGSQAGFLVEFSSLSDTAESLTDTASVFLKYGAIAYLISMIVLAVSLLFAYKKSTTKTAIGFIF